MGTRATIPYLISGVARFAALLPPLLPSIYFTFTSLNKRSVLTEAPRLSPFVNPCRSFILLLLLQKKRKCSALTNIANITNCYTRSSELKFEYKKISWWKDKFLFVEKFLSSVNRTHRDRQIFKRRLNRNKRRVNERRDNKSRGERIKLFTNYLSVGTNRFGIREWIGYNHRAGAITRVELLRYYPAAI